MKGELRIFSYYLSLADGAFSPFSTLFLSSLSQASTCFIFNWDTIIKEPHTTREENTLQWPLRINLGFWETSHLPLPLLNVNICVSLRTKCWVRGGGRWSTYSQLTCGMFKCMMKHMSRQHKYANQNVSYSEVHQEIVHWPSHLLPAINYQANQHIPGHVNQNQHEEEHWQKDSRNGSHSNNNKQ